MASTLPLTEDTTPGLVLESGGVPAIPAADTGLLFADAHGRIQGRDEQGADLLTDLRRASGKEFVHWRSALSDRETVPAVVWLIGDSMSEGYGATTWAKRWADITRVGLQNEFKDGGIGYLPTEHGIVPMTFPNKFSYGGSPTPGETAFGTSGGNGWGFGRKSLYLDASGESVTWTEYGDRVQVFYTGGPSLGNFSVTIDGTVVAASVSTAESVGTRSGQMWESGVLTLGTHTVTVAWVSGGIVIDGCYIFATDYAAGVHVYEGARSGYTTLQFDGQDTTAGIDRYWADIGFQPHTVTATATPTTNGTGVITGWTGGAFTNDDIGEVVYSGTERGSFPQNVRIVSVQSSTAITVDKNIPAGTPAVRSTRYRYTTATYTSGQFTLTNLSGINTWDRGKTIKGTHIPSGTYIRRVISATSVEISQAVTGSASGNGTIQITNRRKYPTNPDLLVVEFGFNEETFGITKAVYKTGLENVVQTAIDRSNSDNPTMTGIVNDERPSVVLMGLWANAYQANQVVIVDVVSGQNTLVSSAGVATRFTQDDVGRTITTAGNTPIPASTTIASVIDSSNATLSQNAVANGTAVNATIVNRRWQDESWRDFRQAMYELSVTNTWGFFDLHNLAGWIGPNDTQNLTTDNMHPSDRGQQWIADELATLIGGNKNTRPISQGIFNNAGEIIVAQAADIARVSPGKKVITAANLTNSSNSTWVDMTELAFPIAPQQILTLLLCIQYFAAATTTGITISFTGPTSPTWFYASAIGAGGTTATTVNFSGTNTLSTGVVSTLSAVGTAATAPTLVLVRCSIKAGTNPGTVTPRFRSEINASQVTVLQGSDALIL